VCSVVEGGHIGELEHAAESALVKCVRTETRPSWLTIKDVAVQCFKKDSHGARSAAATVKATTNETQ
jgi:hypothetical protein